MSCRYNVNVPGNRLPPVGVLQEAMVIVRAYDEGGNVATVQRTIRIVVNLL